MLGPQPYRSRDAICTREQQLEAYNLDNCKYLQKYRYSTKGISVSKARKSILTIGDYLKKKWKVVLFHNIAKAIFIYISKRSLSSLDINSYSIYYTF